MTQHASRLDRYGGMKEEIAGIRSTVSSADRNVTVVAGPGGAVLDVRLSERAFDSTSPRTLAGAIMTTLRLAVADAARTQADIVQRYVGDRLRVTDRVMATQQEILGDRIAAGDEARERPADPVVAAPYRPPATRRPAPVDEEDEGFTGFGEGRGNW